MRMSVSRARARTVVLGFVMIAEGIATIVCLGHAPGWQIDFIFWDTQRWLKKETEKEKRNAVLQPNIPVERP